MGVAVEKMAAAFELTDEEREQTIPSGKTATIRNRTHWAITYLVHAGLLPSSPPRRPRRNS